MKAQKILISLPEIRIHNESELQIDKALSKDLEQVAAAAKKNEQVMSSRACSFCCSCLRRFLRRYPWEPSPWLLSSLSRRDHLPFRKAPQEDREGLCDKQTGESDHTTSTSTSPRGRPARDCSGCSTVCWKPGVCRRLVYRWCGRLSCYNIIYWRLFSGDHSQLDVQLQPLIQHSNGTLLLYLPFLTFLLAYPTIMGLLCCC